MTTTTTRDLINDAHRLLNLTASGNVLPEVNYQDNLRALNQMIDSWNTERLAVFATQDQVITWPSGAISGTLGPSGSLGYITYAILQQNGSYILVDEAGGFLATDSGPTERPILVDDSSYFFDPQTKISYGIKLINQQQYNGIAVKTVTSTYPQVMWVNMTYPDIVLTVYPVPMRTLHFHIVSVSPLTQPALLSTPLTFPPGYLRAFRYNLACELAPEFGLEPSAQVQRIAMYSKRNLKRINNPDDLMALPYSIVGTRQRFNIYAGNY
jgi:hypothetical protein